MVTCDHCTEGTAKPAVQKIRVGNEAVFVMKVNAFGDCAEMETDRCKTCLINYVRELLMLAEAEPGPGP